MTRENQSELFIHMLTDALEADRLIRKASFVQRYKDGAERFKRALILDLDDAKRSLEPLDCVQQMERKPRESRLS